MLNYNNQVIKLIFKSNFRIEENIMKKTFIALVILTTFIFNTNDTKSEVPIIELPAFPIGYSMEIYEDNDDLYALKLIEYYKIAVTYQTQLTLLGDTSSVNLSVPSPEELTDNDSKNLKKYYNQAKKLKNIIVGLPNSARTKQLDDLKEKINKVQIQNDSLKVFADSYSLLKNRLDENLKNIENVAKKLEELNYNYEISRLEKVKDLIKREKLNIENQKIHSQFRNNVLSINLSGNIIDEFSNLVENQISFGAGLSLNTGYFLNLGEFIDFDISMLNFRNKFTDSTNSNNITTTNWENNIYNVGLSFNYKKLVKLQGMDVGLRGGLGYFWGGLNAVNTNYKEANICGQTVSLDLNLKNEISIVPYELYMGIKWYMMNNDYRIDRQNGQQTTNLYNFGDLNLINYNVGIRIPVWRHMNYQEIENN
jgi:hypothetical protein